MELFKTPARNPGKFFRVWVGLVIVLLAGIGPLQAQNVNRPEKIKSVTEVEIEMKGGKESEMKKSFQQFDEKGNVIEEIEYEDDGKVKNHATYEYNDKGQKIKETTFLPDGKVESISTYTYDEHGNRTMKIVANRDGELKSKKVFRYEYR